MKKLLPGKKLLGLRLSFWILDFNPIPHEQKAESEIWEETNGKRLSLNNYISLPNAYRYRERERGYPSIHVLSLASFVYK